MMILSIPGDRNELTLAEVLASSALIQRSFEEGYVRVGDYHPWSYGGDGPFRVADEPFLKELRENNHGMNLRAIPVPCPEEGNPPWGFGYDVLVLGKPIESPAKA